jgi:DNA primase
MVYQPSSLNFKTLKAHVSIGMVLKAYGLDHALYRRGDQLIGPCPLYGGDHPTAFRAHLKRGIWNCFTACGGGDVVELIRRIEQCDYLRAAKILKSMTSNLEEWCTYQHQKVSSAAKQFKPFHRSLLLNPKSDFLQKQKGISQCTALQFEAGQTNLSPFLKGTVAVRLHDMQGRPLGYCGRYIDPQTIQRFGKWRFPPLFPKAQTLYNAHRALAYRKNGIVLVECPWAVMRLTQSGFPGAVALLGTGLSSAQIQWLADARIVVVMLDGDPAGRKATPHIVSRLSSSTKARPCYLPDGLEPEDLQVTHLSILLHPLLFSS